MNVVDTELVQYKFLQIEDFQIAKREEDIGFYAGFVGEIFVPNISMIVEFLI